MTSAAHPTPKVAGRVAHILEPNPALTHAEIRDILNETGSAVVTDAEKQVGKFIDADAAVLAAAPGEFHVCAINATGRLWHTIRFSNGSWQLFGDVVGQTGDVGTLSAVAAAAVNGVASGSGQ